jgi:hypothetical protein
LSAFPNVDAVAMSSRGKGERVAYVSRIQNPPPTTGAPVRFWQPLDNIKVNKDIKDFLPFKT